MANGDGSCGKPRQPFPCPTSWGPSAPPPPHPSFRRSRRNFRLFKIKKMSIKSYSCDLLNGCVPSTRSSIYPHTHLCNQGCGAPYHLGPLPVHLGPLPAHLGPHITSVLPLPLPLPLGTQSRARARAGGHGNLGCTPLRNSCQTDNECCIGNCAILDGGQSPVCCVPGGSPCQEPYQCCSGNCANSKCVGY